LCALSKRVLWICAVPMRWASSNWRGTFLRKFDIFISSPPSP
jgi:hypothetical protein